MRIECSELGYDARISDELQSILERPYQVRQGPNSSAELRGDSVCSP